MIKPVELFLVKENILCQRQQPERGEAAAAPCPKVQLVARLKMCSQQAQAQRGHAHTTDTHRYVAGHTDHRLSEHSHEHRQHQQPHPPLLSG